MRLVFYDHLSGKEFFTQFTVRSYCELLYSCIYFPFRFTVRAFVNSINSWKYFPLGLLCVLFMNCSYFFMEVRAFCELLLSHGNISLLVYRACLLTAVNSCIYFTFWF